MFRFTNGLVFYTREDAEKALKAGYILVEKQMEIEEVIDETDKNRDKPISTSNKTTKKPTGKNKNSI